MRQTAGNQLPSTTSQGEGDVYRDLLWKVFPHLSQYTNPQKSIPSRFMHAAGLPHLLPAVVQFLNNVFLEQRTARDGPTARPAPSPWFKDLTYVSGHLKSTVYPTEVSDVQELQTGGIRTTPGILQEGTQTLLRRAMYWFEAQVGHGEHFTQSSKRQQLGSHASEDHVHYTFMV
jgi:hypothetical protein